MPLAGCSLERQKIEDEYKEVAEGRSLSKDPSEFPETDAERAIEN
jgi:hypothetical protein